MGNKYKEERLTKRNTEWNFDNRDLDSEHLNPRKDLD